MSSSGLLSHNYQARRTGGSGYDVIEEIEADCGFCRRRRVSLDEEVTGLHANSCSWLHQPQLPQLSSRQPAHDLLPFSSMFYPERAVSNHCFFVPERRRFPRAYYRQFCCRYSERWKEMKGVQPRNVGLEVAGMLCTALLLGHYPLHTGREIFLSLRNR